MWGGGDETLVGAGIQIPRGEKVLSMAVQQEMAGRGRGSGSEPDTERF